MKVEQIKTVVVVGAGAMGQQIAMQAAIQGAHAGLQVIRCDSFPAAVEKATIWAEEYLAGRVAKGRLAPEAQQEIAGRFTVSEDIDGAAAKADIVIEAIIEKIAVKRELFQRISQLCKADTILATNSSNMASSQLAAVTQNPERLITI